MKRSFSAALAAAVFLLPAITTATAQEVSGKITFYTHFGHFADDGTWDEIASGFAEKYPGAEVEILPVAGYRKEMPTRIASGDYGDVLNVLDSIPPNQYATFYAPLNDMSDMLANHRFIDNFSVDGNVYGFVYGANAEAVVYNKAAFERAGIEGVPKTKKELFEACKKLSDAGIVPFQINMGAGWPMQQWDKAALLFAGDGNYFNAALTSDTPYAANEPYGQSIRFVRELFEAGCTERDYTANNWDQSKVLFGAGEAGMWFLANWSVPQAISAGESLGVENVSETLGMFPLPIDDSGEPAVLLWPDWALGVSAKSENPETAKAFVEYLLTETDISNRAGFIPGDTRIEPSMPQLQELFAPEPPTVVTGVLSSEFKQAMADARLDFMSGTYIRDLVLAEDFDAAIEDVNTRWQNATD